MRDPKALVDHVYEAMHYAGRDAMRSLGEQEIRALMEFNEGNAWIQDVAEEELAHREQSS